MMTPDPSEDMADRLDLSVSSIDMTGTSLAVHEEKDSNNISGKLTITWSLLKGKRAVVLVVFVFSIGCRVITRQANCCCYLLSQCETVYPYLSNTLFYTTATNLSNNESP